MKNVEASDWGYLFLLYFVLSILRVIIVIILYPALANVGLKCTKQDAAFMTWAGLRGALGMTLALIVQSEKHEENISNKDSDRIFFFVGGIAALTLLINATTANRLLDYLGLLSEDTSLDKVRAYYIMLALRSILVIFDDL